MATAAQSFKYLLRTSNFAAINPARADTQIFEVAATGGVIKRALPPSLSTASTTHVAIRDFDTPYGFTRFQNATMAMKRTEALKETFTTCKSSRAENFVHERPNLYTMDDSAFKNLVASARKRKEEYREKLREYPIRARDSSYLHQFLDMESTHDDDQLRSVSQVAELMGTAKIGKQVKGRVLNRVAGGYAVAVAGTVAFLPSESSGRFSVNVRVDRQLVAPFYVEDVLWSSDDMKSLVVLSLTKPEEESGKTGDTLGVKSFDSSQELDIQSLLNDLLSAGENEKKTASSKDDSNSEKSDDSVDPLTALMDSLDSKSKKE